MINTSEFATKACREHLSSGLGIRNGGLDGLSLQCLPLRQIKTDITQFTNTGVNQGVKHATVARQICQGNVNTALNPLATQHTLTVVPLVIGVNANLRGANITLGYTLFSHGIQDLCTALINRAFGFYRAVLRLGDLQLQARNIWHSLHFTPGGNHHMRCFWQGGGMGKNGQRSGQYKGRRTIQNEAFRVFHHLIPFDLIPKWLFSTFFFQHNNNKSRRAQ